MPARLSTIMSTPTTRAVPTIPFLGTKNNRPNPQDYEKTSNARSLGTYLPRPLQQERCPPSGLAPRENSTSDDRTQNCRIRVLESRRQDNTTSLRHSTPARYPTRSGHEDTTTEHAGLLRYGETRMAFIPKDQPPAPPPVKRLKFPLILK